MSKLRVQMAGKDWIVFDEEIQGALCLITNSSPPKEQESVTLRKYNIQKTNPATGKEKDYHFCVFDLEWKDGGKGQIFFAISDLNQPNGIVKVLQSMCLEE